MNVARYEPPRGRSGTSPLAQGSTAPLGERSALIHVQGWRRGMVAVSAGFEHVFGVVSAGALTLMLLWTWAPIIDLMLMSVNRAPDNGIPGLPVTTTWYDQLFSNGAVGAALDTSAWIAVVVGCIVTLVSFAFARNFRRIRARGAFLGVVLLPIFIPGLIFGIALLVFMDAVGLAVGIWGVLWAHVVWALPFAFLTLLMVYLRLDFRWLDAAADLGANWWQRTRDIELPLVATGIGSAFLFGFLLSFNELAHTLFVSGAVTTLPLYSWAQATARTETASVEYGLTTLITLGSIAVVVVADVLMLTRTRKLSAATAAASSDGAE